MTTPLLPCPFCGRGGVFHEDEYSSCAWIACELCDSEGPTTVLESTNEVAMMRSEAIKCWNTRTAYTLTPEQVERARTLVKLFDRYVENECKLMSYELESAQLLREVVGDSTETNVQNKDT